MAAVRASTASSASSSQPCVVLFGWTGCKERYLKKYQQTVWEPLKYRCCLFTRHCQLNYSDKVVREAALLLVNERATCVHLFSNGAGFLWRRIIRSAQHDSELRHALGHITLVVYDSTPGDISAKSFWEVPRTFGFGWTFCWEFFRSPFARGVLLLLSPLLFIFNLVQWFVTLQFVDYFNWTSRYHNELLSGCKAYRWSNLFLFSKDDALIDYRSIQQMMESARAAGCAVASKCWAKSVHVRHLPLHESEYIEAVRTAAQRD
jgi:hypothetical protein